MRRSQDRGDAAALAGASDDTLVVRVAAGDAQAFQALSDRHLDRTVTLAQRVLGNRAEAEDVAQDAFLRLWRNAYRFRPGEARFTTWFYRITVNLCLDRRRRPQMDDIESVPDPVDPGDDALTQIDRKERARIVGDAVARLPDRQRQAVALCYDAELSNAEAAMAMEVSVGALETLLVRARRSLRKQLTSLVPDGLTSSAGKARRGGPR